MQVNTVEKLASVGAFGLWAALHGWLGWLAVLYAICMLLDCVTGFTLRGHPPHRILVNSPAEEAVLLFHIFKVFRLLRDHLRHAVGIKLHLR